MIVVTGGAGFIGSNLVYRLSKQGKEPVVICDRFRQDERWQNLKRVSLEDIIEPDMLLEYLDLNRSEISVIFHLGARVSTTDTDADAIVDHNFKFTVDLIKWCARNDVRLIYASAASVYGDGTKGFNDGEEPDALDSLAPYNVYAWSKLLVDRFVAERRREGKSLPPQCVGLRFFNVYGPNEYHKNDQVSVIKKTYDVIKFGNSARLFKSYNEAYQDGGQLRDFVWVGDCIDVMTWLYDNPTVSGLFNIGSGKARTFNDLAKASFSALDMPERVDYIDMPKGLAEKYQYHTQADISRLRKAGYTRDFTSLEEGIRLYIQDYLKKDDPYL